MPSADKLPRVAFERVNATLWRAVAASGRAYDLTKWGRADWRLTAYPNADTSYGEAIADGSFELMKREARLTEAQAIAEDAGELPATNIFEASGVDGHASFVCARGQ